MGQTRIYNSRNLVGVLESIFPIFKPKKMQQFKNDTGLFGLKS